MPSDAALVVRVAKAATVLPTAARLTSGESFRRCVREGRRAGSRTVVVHALDEQPAHLDGPEDPGQPARVGFIVSRGVGGAVVRNRVRRRLRHLVRERLDALPPASTLVVRANPAAAEASYDELRADLGRCLERVSPPPASQPTASHSSARP